MRSRFLFSALTIIMLTYFLPLTATPRIVFHVLIPEATAQQFGGMQTGNNSGDLKFASFQSTAYGIKMLYPLNWNKEENISDRTVSSSSDIRLTDIVRFSPPFENGTSDKSAENLDVKVDDISDIQPISLAKYTNDTLDDLGKDFKIISENRNATIGNNNPAYKVEYTGIDEDVNLNAMVIYTITDDKAYIISYIAEPSRYSSDLPVVQKMIDSIEFVKKN